MVYRLSWDNQRHDSFITDRISLSGKGELSIKKPGRASAPDRSDAKRIKKKKRGVLLQDFASFFHNRRKCAGQVRCEKN